MIAIPYPAANPKNAPSMTSPATPSGGNGGAPSVAAQTKKPRTSKNPNSELATRMVTSERGNGAERCQEATTP